MPIASFDELMTDYGPHPVTEIDVPYPREGESPFIVIRSGNRTVVINPMSFEDHLCVDAHAFIDGQAATTGVFGMTDGRRHIFEPTGTTSHGWSSTALVALMVGEQREDPS